MNTASWIIYGEYVQSHVVLTSLLIKTLYFINMGVSSYLLQKNILKIEHNIYG